MIERLLREYRPSMNPDVLHAWARDMVDELNRSQYQETVRQARLWQHHKHLFEKMHEVTEAMSPLIHFRLQMEDAKNERLPQF